MVLICLMLASALSAAPRIARVEPESPVAMDGKQQFIIHGSEFERGVTVHLYDLTNDEEFLNRPLANIAKDRLVLNVNFTSKPGRWKAVVENPDGRKSSKAFDVKAKQYQDRDDSREKTTEAMDERKWRPRIAKVEPESPQTLDRNQPFTIHGRDFHPKVQVHLYDLTNKQKFEGCHIEQFNENRLVLSVNFTSQPARWRVKVVNPDGRTSSETFYVKAVKQAVVADDPGSDDQRITLDKYKPLGQLDKNNYKPGDGLFDSIDSPGKKTQQVTCLATCYLMIARGNDIAGCYIDDFWDNKKGGKWDKKFAPPAGFAREVPLNLSLIQDSLRKGNPVILHAVRKIGDSVDVVTKSHFVLVVGIDKQTLTVNDPLIGNKRQIVDASDLQHVISSDYRFDKMRMFE